MEDVEKLRKIFFYIFVAIYLTLCPLTILYALGYLFRPGPEPEIFKSGLLYLATLPPDAEVHLGETCYPQKTPLIIRDLMPNNYPLKISLPDHIPWIQTVPIEAGKSTVLDKLILLPQEWDPKELSPRPAQELIPLTGTPLFLLKEGSKVEDYLIYDTETSTSRPLFPDHSFFREAVVLSVVTVEKSSALFMRVKLQQKEWTLWVEPKVSETVIQDLSGLIPEGSRIDWDPQENQFLFSFQIFISGAKADILTRRQWKNLCYIHGAWALKSNIMFSSPSW